MDRATVMEYLQNLRVEEARRMLEHTSEPVDEIGAAVGYEDTSFFRRLFERLTGLTPSQYRRLFRPVARERSRLMRPVVGDGDNLPAA